MTFPFVYIAYAFGLAAFVAVILLVLTSLSADDRKRRKLTWTASIMLVLAAGLSFDVVILNLYHRLEIMMLTL